MLNLKTRIYLTIFIGSLQLPVVNAQICMKDITPQTISAGNFDTSQPGLVDDKLTKLTWDRCVYGQTWKNNTCEGSPIKLTWKEALEIAENNNKRLPDIKELNTIVDLQCFSPPTNLTVFPNTPASNNNGLWTSTPYIVTDTTNTNAWFINLGAGLANYRDQNIKNFVRFIVIPTAAP
jgi:hypothetical protein